MKKLISLLLILTMTASLFIINVSASDATAPYQVLECEENVYVEYLGADYTANVITTVDGASGGKTVRTNLGPINWTITPDKTGYYTIDIVLKRTDTVLSEENSTFTLDGTTVYNGVMTNWWGTCDTRIVDHKLLTAGQSYTLAWASRPDSTVSADYFNLYFEQSIEAESGTYYLNLPAHYTTVGDAATAVAMSGASGGSVVAIVNGGSLRVPVTISERGWYSFDVMGMGDAGVTGTIRIDEKISRSDVGRIAKAEAVSLESGDGTLTRTEAAAVMFMDKGSKTVSLSVSGGTYSCDYISLKRVADIVPETGIIEAELYERSNDKACTTAFAATSKSDENGTVLSGVKGNSLEFVYVFEVPESGTYHFDVVGAADSTATDISFVFDDEMTEISGKIAAGDWKTKETEIGTATLSAGLHTLTLSSGSSLLTVNAILFRKMFECEENGVQVLVDGTDVTSDCIVEDANASGGKYIKTSEGTVSWTFAPTKTGYYTFDLVTGGDASIMSGNSTFTINGETVFNGVVSTNGAQNATNAKTTRVAKKYLASGSTYTVLWASKPEGTICPDYFNIYYEEPEEQILECEANGVMLDGKTLAEGSSAFITSSDASGGKFVRSNGIFSWVYTPDKDGNYTFLIVTGGQADAMSGDSTFTVNGEVVYTGVIATNDSWGVANAPVTELFTMYMTAGTSYTLSWASYPCATTVCPDYFKVYYEPAAETGTFKLECEANGVMLDGKTLAEGSSAFITSSDASGGKFVRSNGIFSWVYTPDKDGNYTFSIVTGGQGEAANGDNTFTVNGKTVYTGPIATNGGWSVKDAPETELFTMYMTAGTTYTLSWASYPTATTVCPDYFNVVFEEETEAETNATILNAETDFDYEAGHGIGWYDTTPDKNMDEHMLADEKYHYADVYSNNYHKNRCVGDAVAYMVDGEWFRYTIDAEQSGYYRIEVGVHTASCANNEGSKANFAVTVNGDGATKTTVGVYRDGDTYNWQVPGYYDFGLFWLDEGANKIKVSFEGNYGGAGNIDAIRVTAPMIKLYKTADTDDDFEIVSGTERLEAEDHYVANGRYSPTSTWQSIWNDRADQSGSGYLKNGAPDAAIPFQMKFTAKVTGTYTFALGSGSWSNGAIPAVIKVNNTEIYSGPLTDTWSGCGENIEPTVCNPIDLVAGQEYTFTYYQTGADTTFIDYVDVAYEKAASGEDDEVNTDGDVEVKFIAPGRYKAKADLTGWVKSDVSPILYAAVYTKDNVIVETEQASTLVQDVLTTGVITVGNGQYVKLFMWNAEDMKPLIGSIIYKQ